LQTPGDFRFADASPMQFPNLSRMKSGGNGPAQSFANLPGVS
jgi:hypothetical protein